MCLIKNQDLIYNPKSFIYKLSSNTKEIKATINDVKAFEIYNISSYERHNVKIDRSSETIENMDFTRKVKFNDEQLFLKYLIKGKANLYHYTEPNLTRFFYSINNSSINQLVFKSFRTEDGTRINKNNYFKQQILNDLICEKVKKGKINSLKYRKADLVDIFMIYNTCINSKMINYTLESSKKTKSIFHINIKSGANFSSFYLLSSTSSRRHLYFENQQNLRFGVELEYVMPFNNNKWSLIVEPSYIFPYSAIEEDTIGRETKVEYSTIELPFGLRHYLFLNKNSKFFINSSLVIDFPMNSIITGENNFNIDTTINYSFGIGYKFKDKISLEFRTFTERDLLGYSIRVGNYRATSLIIGYSIF